MTKHGKSLSFLPQVGRLLQLEAVLNLCESWPRALVVKALRVEMEQLRAAVLRGERVLASTEGTTEELVGALPHRLDVLRRGDLRRMINATGVVVHTNLGRSPLSQRALDRVVDVASGYSNLEYDVEGRKRGRRMEGVKELLRELTGAEDALVVNNCAAAVMLALSATAKGKEAILSRGEMIEIGGSYRVPDVMAASGVILREVGTTNRTHLRDYANAICDETALLLKVHCSNYAIKGFTKEVELEELVALGNEHNVPVMADLGSGLLLDFNDVDVDVRTYDGSPIVEPTVQQVIKSGVDLVAWSGDKMLGASQAGILLGKHEWVERAKKHPIARAVRADKLALAALEATLQTYLEGEDYVLREIPAWRYMSMPLETLQHRAEELSASLHSSPFLSASVTEGRATVGGGAVPHTYIPSVRVSLQTSKGLVEQLESYLRAQPVPIVGLLEGDQLHLDLRTLEPDDLTVVRDCLLAYQGGEV